MKFSTVATVAAVAVVANAQNTTVIDLVTTEVIDASTTLVTITSCSGGCTRKPSATAVALTTGKSNATAAANGTLPSATPTSVTETNGAAIVGGSILAVAVAGVAMLL